MSDSITDMMRFLTSSTKNDSSLNAIKVVENISNIFAQKKEHEISKETWINYLNHTKNSAFLLNLPDIKDRYLWAETTFKAIKTSGYNISDLLANAVKNNPAKPVFHTLGESKNSYSYSYFYAYTKKIAAAFLKNSEYKPRVAIFSENRFESAAVDIACLTNDIFVAPLNVHFGYDVLHKLFSQFNFNIVFVDTSKRIDLLQSLQKTYQFEIVELSEFENYLNKIKKNDIEKILSERKKFTPEEISTVMFTSGSTGLPKSVGFTNYNLITKRFARGAVLPFADNNTKFLSYLPLYHTFGRYLELQGTIYWEGSYVFSGRNDAVSLINNMQLVSPTAFISIPLRWKEIYENYHTNKTNGLTDKSFKDFCGGKLKWGLSAAGYLEPKIFNFFNSNDIILNSGFGMTEASGGISMTVPGKYVKDSVGVPLPGINLKFSETGELLINGHYVARYLNGNNSNDNDYWFPTGDLFKEDEEGNLFILDRVKDIYKNIKGQTIAPAFIEKELEGVPGIKQAFTVGDMKPYNTMLIVPDYKEPLIKKAVKENKLAAYISSIITSVNKVLFPYERIIRFKIIDKEFSLEKGEITAKSTFNRKVIEVNYKTEIDELYEKSELVFTGKDLKIIFPVWTLKELGVSENNIKFAKDMLTNTANNSSVIIKVNKSSGRIQVGSFEYIIKNNLVDLNLFIRQPLLWSGNLQLQNFFEVKEEWDIEFHDISTQLFPVEKVFSSGGLGKSVYIPNISKHLNYYLDLITKILYDSEQSRLSILKNMTAILNQVDHNVFNLLCRRIEVLANHPSYDVRCAAYRALLLSQPRIDYNKYLPSFIHSGKSFLNKKSINQIVSEDFSGQNFNHFRNRLEAYREKLEYPVNSNYLKQLKHLLELLAGTLDIDLKFYPQIRAELISWILHKKDTQLSKFAQQLFDKIAANYNSRVRISSYEKNSANWNDKFQFALNITDKEKEFLFKLLIATNYLKQAFILSFNEDIFNLINIKEEGIYISKIDSSPARTLFRISINFKSFRHYDFLISSIAHMDSIKIKEIIYMMIKTGDTTSNFPVVPKIGNFYSKMGAATFNYIGDLTLWEKLRAISADIHSLKFDNVKHEIEIMFIRCIASFFRFLKYSSYKIIPGNLTPNNVVAYYPFYKQGAVILSIANFQPFKNFTQLIDEIYQNFILMSSSHYPFLSSTIKIDWIFYAMLEGLGIQEGNEYLNSLQMENPKISASLKEFIHESEYKKYRNTYLKAAVFEFNEWMKENKNHNDESKKDSALDLYKLYNLHFFSDIERYLYFYETYFASHPFEIKNLVLTIINSVIENPNQNLTNKIEIKELLDNLTSQTDKDVFYFMFLQTVPSNVNIEFITQESRSHNSIALQTELVDTLNNKYYIQKAVSAADIGRLQKLFLLDNYPLNVNDNFNYIILFDDLNEPVGGIAYTYKYNNTAHIEGIEIIKSLRVRKLGEILLDDFCNRMIIEGVKHVTTGFFLRKFFEKTGFNNETEWGGLVKHLHV